MKKPVIATPEVTNYILRRFNLHADKKLGQNFLIDEDIVRRIAAAAELAPGEPVLEVGPGIGTLTQALAETGADVTAVELDKRLLPVLEKTLEGYENVRVINADVLELDVNSAMSGKTFKVAANLPYYITTPIIFALLEKKLPLERMVIMVQKEVAERDLDISSPEVESEIGSHFRDKLLEDIELLDGASAEFDIDLVNAGKLSPVFFGSALTNFGVETFLKHFLKMTTSPLPRKSTEGLIDPFTEDFSAFVFKIQANMNKAHRDRIAFMRICSGKFTAGMEVNHVQGGRKVKLSQPQQLMASERKIIEEAYAGDIIGVFDPGIFSIGDTLELSNKKFAYEGIPTFAPEHFARVRQIDTMKRKQFIKGINQIAQEGAIQIFQEYNTGMEEIIVGVVGVLQFDVLKFRLESEYNVDIRLEPLPYEYIRWIENPTEINLDRLVGTSDMKKIKDLKDRPLLLFVNEWSVGMVLDRNKDLRLSEFAQN